jgi:hypothetical protein
MTIVVNEFLYMLIGFILIISSFVSSYVVLKRLFKDHVGMFFIAELFLMVFLMIVMLIADVIKILVSGAMEIEFCVKDVVITTVFGAGFGIFIAYEEHKGVELPPII